MNKLSSAGSTPPETSSQETRLPHPPEMTVKTILVPTDFSDCSRKAVHYGESLARLFGAELVLLHVYEPVPPVMEILEKTFEDTGTHENAARELEQWRQQTTAMPAIRTVLRNGRHPHQEIVAAATDLSADLLILGNHGHNALGRAMLGATAEKVVRHAPCPVLVVREREHDFIPEPASGRSEQ